MANRGLWAGLGAALLVLSLGWLALPPDFLAEALERMIKAQRAYLAEMRAAVRALKAGDAAALATLLGGAFLYGVLHAVGPGHGKAVIASYVLADGATLRRGLAVTALSSVAQGASAVLLVGILAAVIGLGRGQVEHGAWIVEIGATALLVLLGLVQAFRAARGGHDHDHGHHHHPGPSQAASKDHGHHDHHHHAHCGHDHAPPPSDGRSMLAVALTVGIRPCTGAIVLLLFCLVQGVFVAGIAGAFAMAAGTGITVAILAIGAVYGRRLIGGVAEATDRAAGVQRAVAVLGWLAVAGFGSMLFAAAWRGPAGLF